MKVGFTPTETYHMFRSLRKEVFNYFDYDQPITFGVRENRNGLFPNGGFAQCDFSDDPDTPYYWGKNVNRFARGIRVNAEFLPMLYEDELICILLHELAHATAGLHAQHGPEWQSHARQIGAVPDSALIIRNWQKAFPPGHPSYHYAIRASGPTLDAFSGSL